MKTLTLRPLASGILATFLCSLVFFQDRVAAQGTAAQVTVTGRVLNVATGLYLKNAEVRLNGTDNYVYTEDDGSYAIQVPAGAIELTASYSSVRSLTASINAAPGRPNVIDFDLQSLVVDTASGTKTTDEVIILDRFVVTTDREGQARAIMNQRAAINAITIIATDNFGDVTMNSVGEILKYMPGISLDYSDDDTSGGDATGVRIGGLDRKYTSAAIDGIAVSTNERAVDLTTLSATGIETIEFVQTLTASMDAGSAAGRINFVTKDPFSRKGAQLRYQFGLNGHSAALNLGGTYLPDDRKHTLVLPSAQINYGGVFFHRRFAIEFNLSHDGSFNFPQQHTINYSYLNPDPVRNPGIDFSLTQPVIAGLGWRPMPQIIKKYAGNLNAAWKILPALTLSMRGGFFRDEREYFALYTVLNASILSATTPYLPSYGVDPLRSNLTHWVVNNVGNNSTRIASEYNHRYYTNNTLFATPRITYKHGNFSADLYAGYTGRVGYYRDVERGFFRSSNTYLSNVGWIADRPSASSPTWTITQTNGDPWKNPENWSKRDIYNNGIRSRPERSENDQYVGGLDLAYACRALGMPVTIKIGGLARRNDYNNKVENNYYNYCGPTGRPQEAIIPYSQNYVFDFPLGGKSGNINAQGWRVDETYALYKIYQEHPEWFTVNSDNLLRRLTGKRDLTEDITAGYIDLTSRIHRLRFNLGIRIENTKVKTLTLWRRTNQEVIDAGFEVGSPEGLLYQYYNGERNERRNSYTNAFLSGGIKYDITQNLQAQVSASQSVLRPDYANLSGVVTYREEDNTVYIPNGTLKPEYMTKFYAGLNWRLEPAGTINVYAYRLDIRDKQIARMEITREEAESIVGYPMYSEGGLSEGDTGDESSEVIGEHTTYYTAVNSPSNLSVYGLTVEYNQQLTFLPGYLKGLSVFGSYTWSAIHGSQIDEDRIGQLKRSANGGIRYRFGRAHVQLRGAWNDTALIAVTRPAYSSFAFFNDHQYEEARMIVDLSGGFKISNHCEISFSIRNLFDAPRKWYSNVPDRLSRYILTGSYVNVSIKGSF